MKQVKYLTILDNNFQTLYSTSVEVVMKVNRSGTNPTYEINVLSIDSDKKDKFYEDRKELVKKYKDKLGTPFLTIQGMGKREVIKIVRYINTVV